MKRAFTLVEIIVVIGILAVLSGLLFPVFAASKHSAKVEVAKQYLREQYIALELYANDHDGVYPGYEDVFANNSLQIPCSDLYSWKIPCWQHRTDVANNPDDPSASPMIGGRGYIYALQHWDEIDKMGKDEFLGWDRTKPYPLLVDVFTGNYKLIEFEGVYAGPNQCVKFSFSSTTGCRFPEVLWYAYSDGSLKVARNAVDIWHRHMLSDWYHVFSKQMDKDTRSGQ